MGGTARAPIRLGTRGSRLARTQAEQARRALTAVRPDLECAVVTVRTAGDRDQTTPLPQLGEKGIFVKELDAALLEGRIDLAVHSCKDLPSTLDARLVLAATLPREDPRDVFCSTRWARFRDLPAGATLATGSPRRVAQVKARRPDLRVVGIRGNVETRLGKLESQDLDGLLLAGAGLRRLGLADQAREWLDPAVFVPQAGQGVIALLCRREDDTTRRTLAAIDAPPAHAAIDAERAVLRRFQAGCHVPAAAWARVEGDRLTLTAFLADPEGKTVLQETSHGPTAEAEGIGRDLADRVLEAGGRQILAALNRG